MTGIALSFAELHYLLAAEAKAAERLQVNEVGSPGDPMAGLSALVARGLITTEGGLRHRPELGALISKLTAPDTWIEVGFARPSAISAIQLFDSSHGRVHASARPYGTVAFYELENETSINETVAELAVVFLSEAQPGAIFLRCENGSADAQYLGLRSLTFGEVELSTPQESEQAPDVVKADLETTKETVISFLSTSVGPQATPSCVAQTDV